VPDPPRSASLDLDDRVFAVRRSGAGQTLVCVTNLTSETVPRPSLHGLDVVSSRSAGPLVLGPYGFAWVQPA
jgi:hypothetical protein